MRSSNTLSLNSLITQLQQCPFSEDIKARFFTTDVLLAEQHLFLGLASVFAPAFPPISADQERLLNAATYLGAKAIYQLDGVLDQQVQGQQRIDQAHYGQLFFLESQRLLSQLFTLQDPFWPVYYRRIQKHYQELSLSKKTTDPLTEITYMRLLDYKYAMLYCPIDALFFLTGKTDQLTYTMLIDSLRWFSKGYNLPNEVIGLAEDVSVNINNYAYWRLVLYLEQLGMDAQSYTVDNLQRLLYVSGLGTILMDEAIEALMKAVELAAPLGLKAYQTLIQHRIINVNERKSVIITNLGESAD